MEGAGVDVLMPPIEGGQYLIDYLFEFGPVKSGGPIDAADLVAWQTLLGVEWQPWQARLLIRLSRAYQAEMYAATKRDAKSPWAGAEKSWRAVQRRSEERRLDAFLR